jgi:hypothetical protein
MPWDRNMTRTGISQVTNSLDDELLAAVACLDCTQRQSGGPEEIKASLQVALTHLVANFQRMAIYSASLYIHLCDASVAGRRT